MSGPTRNDPIFAIHISPERGGDVYLSCPWRKGTEQKGSWVVVQELDAAGFRAIGDVTGFDTQDEGRIRRIMGETTGFVVVLPFRESEPSGTSSYIVDELRVAATLSLPMAVYADRRIGMRLVRTATTAKLVFRAGDPVEVDPKQLFGPFDYDDPSSFRAQVGRKLEDFLECVRRRGAPRVPTYAFLSTRLKGDFAQAREAIESAVETAAGIPCVWAGCQRYATNVKDIQNETRLLIQHATFVVADLTFGPESPDYDSPSRAHEVGMAEACSRPVCLVAQSPRRSPYFAASHLQMYFWDDEAQLHGEIMDWVTNHRGEIGRRVYTHELPKHLPTYLPSIRPTPFAFDRSRRYTAPNAFPLTTFEGWVVAVGFGMNALALSLLVEELLGFQDTFDYAAILAGIAALIFSSDLSRGIRRILGQWKPLRWLVPASGIALLVIWALLR